MLYDVIGPTIPWQQKQLDDAGSGSTATTVRACESRASAQAARAQHGGYGDMLVAAAQRRE
jgi:hypothetical protein